MTAMDNVAGVGADVGAGDRHSNKRSKILWFGMGLVLVILLLAAIVLYLNVNTKENELEASLEQQEMALATGRSQSISMWLNDLETQGDRIVNGGVFRLFASDVSLLDGDVSVMFDAPENAPQSERDEIIDLARQLPMLRNILRESTAYAGFFSSRIVNSRCETYVASETGVPRLTSEQMANVKAVLDTGKTTYSNVYSTSNGLLIDMFMPIFPPQVDDNTVKPVSVLMLSRIVTPRLAEFVKQSPLAGDNIQTYLVQLDKDQLELITPGLGPESLRKLDMGIVDTGEGKLPFANRIGVTGENVYSLAIKVPGIDWWLFEEIKYDDARADLNKSSRLAIGIAFLVSLVLVLVVSLLWWWLVGNEHRQTAARVQTLLNYIEEQKELLDGINATITDLISLTDDKGVIQYANLSFAEAVGRKADEVVGLDIPALFGFDTGKRLIGSDHQVLMTGEPLVVNETIYLQSRKHEFQIIKAPLAAVAGRKAKGIVSVYRDITDLIEAQERSKRVVKQTIDALVRTIEETDTYLAGHSRFMSSLAGLLARSMNLSDSSVATVEAAANLSQIGKMFVPKDILNKPGVLTNEEKQVMEEHVEHSRRVLQNIEFDLPIVEAIYEMNERLDGTGYPRHLEGDSIGIHARILAVANAFTAMARPRSYRNALSISQVLSILKEQGNSYDQKVVDALAVILTTSAGERLVNTLSTKDKN